MPAEARADPDRGPVPLDRPGEPTWVLSARSGGGTQIVRGSSGDGSRSHLSSTVDVTRDGVTGPAFTEG
jgi:hypothetical protein